MLKGHLEEESIEISVNKRPGEYRSIYHPIKTIPLEMCWHEPTWVPQYVERESFISTLPARSFQASNFRFAFKFDGLARAPDSNAGPLMLG